jgi:hypothetical protein
MTLSLLFQNFLPHIRRYTSAERRAQSLEDSDSIIRANEGKSNCLRGKERMVRRVSITFPVVQRFSENQHYCSVLSTLLMPIVARFAVEIA